MSALSQFLAAGPEDYPLGELGSKLGLRFLSIGPDEVRATMPVEGNRQPYGLLHGGASAALAEQVGSIAAYLHAPEGTVPVGVELSCTHHRSLTEGTVTASCRVAHTGQTLATVLIDVRDERERLVCSARLTCLYRAP